MAGPKSCAVVLTSIGDLAILDDYCANFDKYGHLDTVSVFAIPDVKTPRAAYDRCANLTRRGLTVHCPSLDDQQRYLSRLGAFGDLVPFNSDNRRNVGYLMALESASECIVSIDDDNYCLPTEDFLSEHAVVCKPCHTGPSVESDDGWFNICELLETEPQTPVYPRGFPYHKRHRSRSVTQSQWSGRVVINEGLWLRDPDVDAMTWLIGPVTVRALRSPSIVLGPTTWSPINSQNTALAREVIASYYFVRMGHSLGGFAIDRYGDIFSGFFALACIRHMGHAVRFGRPVADHRRNKHDYLNDMLAEAACIQILEDITAWLTEAPLEGSTYQDAYLSLAAGLEDAIERLPGRIWTDATRAYFHDMAYCMRSWVNACRKLS